MKKLASSPPSPPRPRPPSSSSSNFCLVILSLTILVCTLNALMTIKGGTSQACAACKYQRRRCSKECVLAPFFPAEKAKEFQNAHRLFGVRNIMNILKQVPPQQKEDAMTSIIFESDMRAQYPVRGCMGIISQLHVQLQQTVEELRMVQSKLAICKEQFQYNNQILPLSPNSNNYSSNSLPQLHLGITASKSTDHDHHGLPIYPQYNCGSSEMPIELLAGNAMSAAMNGIYVEGEDNNMVKAPLRSNQNQYYNCLEPVQSNLVAPSQVGYPIQQELDVSHYDDMQFDTIADDRHSHIGCKEACESRYYFYLSHNSYRLVRLQFLLISYTDIYI